MNENTRMDSRDDKHEEHPVMATTKTRTTRESMSVLSGRGAVSVRQRIATGVAAAAVLGLTPTVAATAAPVAADPGGAAGSSSRLVSAPVAGTATSDAVSERRGKERKNGPWSGFEISKDQTAGGGWIGARKLGGKVVYRIDPAKKARPTASTKYAPAKAVRDAGKTATRRETAKAAYVLSRYGTYRYAVQSAAVDVAVDHLLTGGRYALKGRKTIARMRQTGQAKKVRSFAQTMLDDAAKWAGTPRLAVSVSGAAVGGTVRATIRLRSATGKPMAAEVVRVRYPGSDVEVVRTDQAGTAVATFVATEAGRHQVQVSVRDLPQWRLSVRKPAKAKASRLARAGVKATARTSRVAVVTVKPTIQVSSAASGLLTSAVPGRFVLAGGEDGTRTATVRLHGPFSTAAATSCAKSVAVTRSMTVTGNGTYAMPALKAPAAGFYTWSVAVAGDSVNEPVSGCGGSIAIKTQPSVKVVRGAETYDTGDLLKSKVTVTGLPRNQRYTDYANVKIYGPFTQRSNVHCGEAKLAKRSNARITENGSVWADPKPINQAGYYALVVTLPAGTFSLAATSKCEAAESTVRFQ